MFAIHKWRYIICVIHNNYNIKSNYYINIGTRWYLGALLVYRYLKTGPSPNSRSLCTGSGNGVHTTIATSPQTIAI